MDEKETHTEVRETWIHGVTGRKRQTDRYTEIPAESDRLTDTQRYQQKETD